MKYNRIRRKWARSEQMSSPRRFTRNRMGHVSICILHISTKMQVISMPLGTETDPLRQMFSSQERNRALPLPDS